MTQRHTMVFLLASAMALAACHPAEKDWNEAVSANSLNAYQNFVQKYPGDEHADVARGKILALQDDQAWTQAQRADSVQSYQDYLKAEGGGIHVLEAKAKIASLERSATEAAQAAQKPNDPVYRVELPQFANKAAADSKRKRLQTRFGSLVHDLVTLPPAGANRHYRVVSSPMSQADAGTACDALERSHQPCKVVPDPGQHSAD